MVRHRTIRYALYALLIAALPAIHLLIPSAVHERTPELADFAMLASAVLALAYTLACLRKPGYDRRYIVCLALGLACWIAGMAYAIARSGTDENLLSTYVLFVSYGAPLLYAAMTTQDEPSSLPRRVVDGVLLLLLVVLCYLGVRDLTDANGFLKQEDMDWVVVAFDVENLFLLGTFLIRYLTAADEGDHRFFGIGTAFLACMRCAPASTTTTSSTPIPSRCSASPTWCPPCPSWPWPACCTRTPRQSRLRRFGTPGPVSCR